MLIAILVPEVVLWCAWEQRWVAKRLMENVNPLVDGSGPVGDDVESEEACIFC